MSIVAIAITAVLFLILYDSATVVTSTNKEQLATLANTAPEDLPENKTKVLLRMLTARIVLYVLIAVAGGILIFLIRKFFPLFRK